MGAWSTISIDNKQEIGVVKYGVPYFIKFIPRNNIATDFNKYIAVIDKRIYIQAMQKLLKVSHQPFANYFLVKGIRELSQLPGKNIIINYSELIDSNKNLHIQDLIAGNPNTSTNMLLTINSYGMWLDLMTLTGLVSQYDLVGISKYLSNFDNTNLRNFLYIMENKLFRGKKFYEIPILKNQFISMNWYNYLTGNPKLTLEFKVFIDTFNKYHNINFKNDKLKLSMNINSLKPQNFNNNKFAFFDIGKPFTER